MDLSEKYLIEKIKASGELEGGLFAKISLNYCQRYYVARSDLYTVIDHIVYSINNDGTLFATGDSLWNIKRDCHKVGKYNRKNKNQSKSKTFTYAEVKKLLGL